MTTETCDFIIIGSGAGGAAAAWRLAEAGQRVLLLEKGPQRAGGAETLDPRVVVAEGRFKSREVWRDVAGRPLVPEEYFNVGGKTKWYGAALLRYGAHEFGAESAWGAAGFPLAAPAFDAWYAEAERLLDVRRFPTEPDLARIHSALGATGRWREIPLPMGLAADICDYPDEARHFDGFASARGLKADAERTFIARAAALPGFTMRTDDAVTDLLPDASGARRVAGVRTASGRRYEAGTVLLAAGALHSPRLLARYLDKHGLGRLPVRDQVGRHLKLHLLTALLAVSRSRKTDLLRKTAALLSDSMPHSSVQPLGFDGEMIAGLVPRFVPRPFARLLGEHAYGFFLQTEDGSHPDNRVWEAEDGTPRLDYNGRRCPAAWAEHARLVRTLAADLLRAGYLCFSQRIGVTGTAHACGTLRAGASADSSVVDAHGRVHGLDSLHVVDGSVLPRSSRVNPSLTIVAWSLRVAASLADARRVAA